MKKLLQLMHDEANFYGYAKRKGKRYYSMQISGIATRCKIKLEYNCPN